jgi:hypothetical protein
VGVCFEGVGGLFDMGGPHVGYLNSGMGGGIGGMDGHQGGGWGSVGDIAGLLGVSDSHSPMHPGLEGFDAFFGDGSMSPAPQMLF